MDFDLDKQLQRYQDKHQIKTQNNLKKVSKRNL
jgi:hypothetical protein